MHNQENISQDFKIQDDPKNFCKKEGNKNHLEAWPFKNLFTYLVLIHVQT